ncbi:MAG: polysaccharide pyruvyl transferase family protein [Anaerolineaceae bacterium]
MDKVTSTPTILIINFHSTRNAGDFALLLSTRQLLVGAFGNPHIIVSANWPGEEAYAQQGIEVVPSLWALAGVSRNGRVGKQIWLLMTNYLRIAWSGKKRALQKENTVDAEWKKLHDAYVQTDLVVGVPGNQFYSSGKHGWPFPATFSAVSLANSFKKPLYIMPQSIGPLHRWWERVLLKKGYSKARRVYLRDNKSLQLSSSIGLDQTIVEYAPDPAFGLRAEPDQTARDLLKTRGVKDDKPRLGVTVIAPMGHSLVASEVENYYRTVTGVLEQFLTTYDAQVVVFNQVSGPTEAENDGMAAHEICLELQQKTLDIVHIDEALPPALLKACYGQMDAFLASRLHSGIFSLGMGVPTLFIGYLSKTRGLLESIGLDQHVIDIKDLTQEKLWDKLRLIWSGRDQERKIIEAKLPEILEACQGPAEWIKKDFYRERQ